MKQACRHRYAQPVPPQGGRGEEDFDQTTPQQFHGQTAKFLAQSRASARFAKVAIPILSTLLVLAAPAHAAPWVRSFVVTAYEPAFRYGGPAGTTDAPGSDCPKGTVPDNDYAGMLRTGWRSGAQIAELTKPAVPSIEPYRILAPALHHRGFAPDIDTYLNPFAAPDPGLPAVTGIIAEGFDLDGKSAAGGFAAGIDNGLYRALGCLMAFRGPPGQGALSKLANERMQAGLFTMLIRLSGKQSPAHDDRVMVEIGTSPDPLERNIAGVPLRDYSYRLVQGARLTGRIQDGVLTTLPVARLQVPDFAWSQSNRGAADFLRGRLRLRFAADGSATGLLGGYRDWRDLYARMAFNVAVEGPFLEIPYHQNLIAIYYALARNADAMPDAHGRNSAISGAWRLAALPAFAVDSVSPLAQAQPPPSPHIVQERADFARAAASRVIVPSP